MFKKEVIVEGDATIEE